MSGVNEALVKEFFEMIGYLVIQPIKYAPRGRRKRPEEGVDFLVVNLRVGQHRMPAELIWTRETLKTIARGIVAIRGWHCDTFYPQTLERDHPEILQFTDPASVRFAGKYLGSEPLAKILCVPRLPASASLREKTLKILKRGGVDGILPFETIVADLIMHVDVTKNYEHSDVLQTLRILKAYDFVRPKDRQMELFTRRRRERKKGGHLSQEVGAAGGQETAPREAVSFSSGMG